MKRILAFGFGCLLLFQYFPVFAADPLRAYIEAQTRYWGIQEKITPEQMNQLVDLKQKADQPDLSQEQRTKAYTDLFQFVQKLRGKPEGRVPGALAASYWTAGVSPIPPALHFSQPGQLGNFVKKGTGKIPVILIPDIGADASVFESFMKRNQSQFTFYAVTLPGFGGTNPPPRLEKLDFGARQWWHNAMMAVQHFISEQKIKRPVLLGHQAGAYLAMRFALDNPENVRGVIVLNGLLYAPLPGIAPGATQDDRVRVVNSFLPAELFPYPSPSHYLEIMRQNSAWFCKDKERQEFYTRLVTRSQPVVWWNYFAELATTDLTADIKTLKVPMLVLPSVWDKDSPGFQTQTKIELDQWTPVDQSKSSLPITVQPIEDCRAYATEDQPQKLDEAITKWTAQLT